MITYCTYWRIITYVKLVDRKEGSDIQIEHLTKILTELSLPKIKPVLNLKQNNVAFFVLKHKNQYRVFV